MARTNVTPEQRALIGRIGGLTKAAKYNTTDATAAARIAALKRFEHQVDPDGTLSESERRRRAEAAKRAYFARLALKSAKARARKTQRN